MGEARLSVAGADASAAARSLHAWLGDRDEPRGRPVVTPPPGTTQHVRGLTERKIAALVDRLADGGGKRDGGDTAH